MKNSKDEEKNADRWELRHTEISKASVKGEGNTYEVKMTTTELWYDKHDDLMVRNEKEAKYRFIPHEDLLTTVRGLAPFIANICDYSDGIDEIEADIEATGFSMGGEDEHQGVVLIGKKKLGHVAAPLNLITPFIKFQDEHAPYMYGMELEEAIDNFILELKLYEKGKYKPSDQLRIEFSQVG